MAASKRLWPGCVLLIAPIWACGQGKPETIDAPGAIDVIVVTAQKHEQNILDVPIALTAFGTRDLQELHIQEPIDLGQFTAGLSTSMASANSAPVYSIRGVALDDVFANNSGGVQVYVDEVAPVSSAMQTFQIFDVDRIEVLKGPQGTLYGRNATGGAISFYSQMPTAQVTSRMEVTYDSLNVVRATAAVSGPIVERLRGRLAGNVTFGAGSGWQKGVNGSPSAAKPSQWAFRSILETDLSTGTMLRMNLHGGRDTSINESWHAADNLGLGGLLFGIRLASPDRSDRADIGSFFEAIDGTTRPENDTSALGISAKLDIRSRAGTLTFISAYESMRRLSYENYDGSPAVLNDIRYDDNISQFSQEARFAGEHERLTYVVGGFASHDVIRTNDELPTTDVFNLAYGLDLFGLGTGPADTPKAKGVQVLALLHTRQETNAYGLFAHTEYKVARSLTATLAGRYSHEARRFDGTMSDPSGFLSGVPGVLVDFDDVTRSVGIMTGRFGLDYRLRSGLMIYGSVASGFKSGVFFAGPVTVPTGWGFAEPEKLVAYETGFKASLNGNRVQLNGTWFYYDYREKQLLGTVTSPSGPVATLGNVPKSTVTGSEFELQLIPIKGMGLRAGLSYLDARVIQAPTSIRGAPFASPLTRGDPLSYAPRVSYFAIARYSRNLSSGRLGSAQISFSHRNHMVTLLGDPLGVVGESNLLGARLAVQGADDRWALALFGENLGNRRIRTYAYTNLLGDLSYAMAKPRLVGLSLSLHY